MGFRRGNGSIIGGSASNPITQDAAVGVFGLDETLPNVIDETWPGTGAATFYLQGSVSGYTMSGSPTAAGSPLVPGTPNAIVDKFSLTSDGNATLVGSLTQSSSREGGGVSSISTGYSYYMAGSTGSAVEAFSHASDGNGIDLGDLAPSVDDRVQGFSEESVAYVIGGKINSPVNSVASYKFTYTAGTPISLSAAISGGDMANSSVTTERMHASTQNAGYHAGSVNYNVPLQYMEKFTYSSETHSSFSPTIERITKQGQAAAGFANLEYFYFAGGQGNPNASSPESSPTGTFNVIQKFPIAAEDAWTDVGDLTVSRANVTGIYGGDYGYASGGITPQSGTPQTVIDKVAYASDGNATDVGDLVWSRYGGAGGQS